MLTMPLLPKGDYSITISIAEGDLTQHRILHWVNDAIVIKSMCTNVAAGLAGIPMHSISIKKELG